MKYKYIIYVVIFISLLILIFTQYNYNPPKYPNDNCKIELDNTNEAITDIDNIDDYIKNVISYVKTVSNKKLKTNYKYCSRSQIIIYFLNKNPNIESTNINSSGSGISYYRKDANVWSNILLKDFSN